MKDELEELRDEGLVNEIRDFDEGERRWSLTDEGVTYAKELVRDDDGIALWLCEMMFEKLEDLEPEERIVRIAYIFKDDFGVNLFRVLRRNEDKHNIEINMDEEKIQAFDP